MTAGTEGGRIWAGDKPLILASRSASRRDLLAARGIEARMTPADIDERVIEAELIGGGGLPVVVARALAAEKARLVAARSPGRLVLGADQVLAFEDRCWAKADSLEEAASRLKRLAGRTHGLISACAVARDGAILFECLDTAALTMRDLSMSDIETYLASVGDEVLTSVGAYRIEGIGKMLFDRIEGDEATIIGLPLARLIAYFRAEKLICL